MIANKKCNLPFGLWQAVSNDSIAAGTTGCEAQVSDTTLSPVTSGQLHSSHATIMVWSQLQNTGEHTLVDQIGLCV